MNAVATEEGRVFTRSEITRMIGGEGAPAAGLDWRHGRILHNLFDRNSSGVSPEEVSKFQGVWQGHADMLEWLRFADAHHAYQTIAEAIIRLFFETILRISKQDVSAILGHAYANPKDYISSLPSMNVVTSRFERLFTNAGLRAGPPEEECRPDYHAFWTGYQFLIGGLVPDEVRVLGAGTSEPIRSWMDAVLHERHHQRPLEILPWLWRSANTQDYAEDR